MTYRVGPADAARALTEIGRRREQVVRRAVIPTWFWWTIGVLMVELAAAVESRRGVLLGIGIAVFVAGLLVSTVRMVLRTALSAPPRNDLTDPPTVLAMVIAIMTFVAVVVGATLGVGFSLQAAKVSHPVTITVSVTALLLAFGGPMLMRYLTRVMLVSRPWGNG
jgi:hypothetical protein